MFKQLTALALMGISGVAAAQSTVNTIPVVTSGKNSAPTIAKLSYDYVDVAYVKTTFDDDDGKISFNGFGVEGSKLLTTNVFVTAGYSQQSSERYRAFIPGIGSFDAKQEADAITAGLGHIHPLNATVDINLEGWITRLNSKIKSTTTGNKYESDDDTYFSISAALRSMLTPEIEGSLGVRCGDVSDEKNISVSLGLIFHLNSRVGIVGAYRIGDDVDGYTLGARINF